MPVARLPLDAATADTLHALGIRTAGELAALPLPAVADRFGRPGIGAWRLARGEDETYVAPRTPPEPLREAIEFPEPVGDEFTLRGALTVLIERLVGDPRRAGRPPRTLAVSARLAAGGSWRRPVTLREPTADPRRLRDALAPRLVELPGAVEHLGLEITALSQLGRPPALALPAAGGAAARAGLRGRPPGARRAGRGPPVAGGRGGAVVAGARGPRPAGAVRRVGERRGQSPKSGDSPPRGARPHGDTRVRCDGR